MYFGSWTSGKEESARMLGDTTRPDWGLGIDVGTSFVEVALVDRRGYRVLAHARSMNKQVFYGTNVLTRLSFALEDQVFDPPDNGENATGVKECGEPTADGPRRVAPSSQTQTPRLNIDILQEAAHESVLDAIGQLGHGGVDKILANCQMMVVAANSVMTPLFCGVLSEGLAEAPFKPCEDLCCQSGVLFERWRKARGVAGKRGDSLRVLDPIAGFVGGDGRAALAAARFNSLVNPTYHPQHFYYLSDNVPHLMVDLGTNAEIALRNNADLFVASVPAGPTFEGVLASGATGWRGTDVIAQVANMLELGAIDSTGLILDPALTDPLTQEDIRDFQLAKAAVRVGIDMVLDRARVKAEDVATFRLVGAFGAHLDMEAARAVGLFAPQLPEPSPLPHQYRVWMGIIQREDLGGLNNAALIGATLGTMGVHSSIAGYITHIELAKDENFMETLLGALSFG
jgi:uncharacterized 2Fe-2S/4Fe-4S cluster protein (DUF4445 family)